MLTHFRRLSPLLLLIFIDSLSYFLAIPVLLELIFNQSYGMLAASTTQETRNILAGCAIGLSTFSAMMAAPFLGALSDKWGRKKTLLMCASIMMLGFVLPIVGLFQKSLVLVLLGRMITGMGSASQPIAQAAVADLCRGDEKSLFLSWIALAMTLPLILGPLAGSYLSNSQVYSGFSLMTPYYVACLLLAFTFLLLCFGFKETNTQSKTSEHMLSPLKLVKTLPSLLQRYRIGFLLLTFFCLEWAWSQYYQSIGLYFRQVIVSTSSENNTQYTSLFLTTLGLTMSFGLLLLYPWLARWMDKLTSSRVSLIIILLSFLGCACFPSSTTQWICGPLIAILTGMTYVSLLTLISDRVEASEQGFIMGLASTILFSAWFMTALLSGYIVSVHLNLFFYLALAVSFLGCVSLYAHDRIDASKL